MEIQGEVATAIRDAGPTDVMREALTLAALTTFCTERDAIVEETDKMIHRIIKSRDLVCRAFGSHVDNEVDVIDAPEEPTIDLDLQEESLDLVREWVWFQGLRTELLGRCLR